MVEAVLDEASPVIPNSALLITSSKKFQRNWLVKKIKKIIEKSEILIKNDTIYEHPHILVKSKLIQKCW